MKKFKYYKNQLCLYVCMVFITLLSLSCEEPFEVKTSNYHGVIFSSQYDFSVNSLNFVGVDSNYVNVDLTLQDIEKAEEILRNFVEKENASIYEKLDNYKRQYFGYKFKEETVVFINCLTVSYEDEYNWKRYFFLSMDGGDYFFNIKVNITTGTCFDFRIEGSA